MAVVSLQERLDGEDAVGPGAIVDQDRPPPTLSELFGEQAGRGVVPTSRALALSAWVRSVLEEAQQKLLERPPFDPSAWAGRVRLAMTPMMDMALTPRLLGRLAAQAPNATVVVHAAAVWNDVLERLDDGAVDLYVGFAGELKSRHRQRVLWEENVL